MRAGGTLVGLLLACLALTSASTSFAQGTLSAAPVDFGAVKPGSTKQVTVNVQNGGPDPVNVSDVSASSTGFAVDSSTCGAASPIASGDSCNVVVNFSPNSPGGFSGALSIINDGDVSPLSVQLSGTGAFANVQLSNTTLSFSARLGDTTGTQTVTLTNQGPVKLVINGLVTIAGPDKTSFDKHVTANPCADTTLDPGGSCTVGVSFTANAGNRAYSAELVFPDDGVDGPHKVALSGSVLVRGIQASPANLDFDEFVVGQRTAARTVTINNTGTDTLNVTQVAVTGANVKSFQLGNTTCSGTVAPGDSCTVSIRFVPMRAEPLSADLVITNDAAADQHVGLVGSGVRPDGVSALKAATGCTDVALNWVRPSDRKLRGVVVIRNKKRVPRGPRDGAEVKHTPTGAIDTKPATFTTYHYAIFAAYDTWDRKSIVYSRGVSARIRTGRVCRPRNGAETNDLTPNIDWAPYRGAYAYGFRLQRKGRNLLVRTLRKSEFQVKSSWTYNGRVQRLQHGATYTFFVYAYTLKRQRGFAIGQTTWKIR